ncbi:unnamed protein product, partial [Mesorhabditis spiculigera]
MLPILLVSLYVVAVSAKYLPVPLNNFYGAEVYCQSYGAHLAFMNQQGYPDAFTGLRRGADGRWTYTDGTPSIYVNWAAFQPSSDNCTTIGIGGLWYSVPCEQIQTAICYIPDAPTVGPPTLAPTMGPVSYQCPTGWSYFATSGACYWVGSSNTLDAARTTCKQVGSDLVSIHSSEENGFVLGLAFRYTQNCTKGSPWWYSVWTGGVASNGYNYWSDGTPFTYSNFYGHGDPTSGAIYLITQSGCTDFSQWRITPSQTVSLTNFVCKKWPSYRLD